MSVVAALASTGVLRAAINTANPILAHVSPDGGASGVSVDLAFALGRELRCDVELVLVSRAQLSLEAVRDGVADVGFFAADPARTGELVFTPPYVLIEGSYIVPGHSAIQTNADVDRAGTRVGVGRGSAYELFLTRELRAATVHRVDGMSGVLEALRAGEVAVGAGMRAMLDAWADSDAGLRVLAGPFMVVEQAMGVRSDRGPLAKQALDLFVERMKASGAVQQALDRHGVVGATVAPSAGARVDHP